MASASATAMRSIGRGEGMAPPASMRHGAPTLTPRASATTWALARASRAAAASASASSSARREVSKLAGEASVTPRPSACSVNSPSLPRSVRRSVICRLTEYPSRRRWRVSGSQSNSGLTLSAAVAMCSSLRPASRASTISFATPRATSSRAAATVGCRAVTPKLSQAMSGATSTRPSPEVVIMARLSAARGAVTASRARAVTRARKRMCSIGILRER